MKSKPFRIFCEDHRISPHTGYAEVHAGRLRTFMIGRTRRVSDQAELEWIESCEELGRDVKPVDRLVEAKKRAANRQNQPA